jgi:hypothetical protein
LIKNTNPEVYHIGRDSRVLQCKGRNIVEIDNKRKDIFAVSL